MAEIYQRLGSLEREQTRVETELYPLKREVESLSHWRVEMKVLVAKWLTIYGAIAVVGQFIITIAIQVWLNNMKQ